jgi:hypothetical protein
MNQTLSARITAPAILACAFPIAALAVQPITQTLNGPTLAVVVNNVTTHFALYYTSPTQIAAVLPAYTATWHYYNTAPETAALVLDGTVNNPGQTGRCSNYLDESPPVRRYRDLLHARPRHLAAGRIRQGPVDPRALRPERE